MRNYLKTRVAKIGYSIGNNSPPPDWIIFGAAFFIMGEDDDDLYEMTVFRLQNIAANEGGFYVWDYTVGPFDCFPLMDKSNIMRWFNGVDRMGSIMEIGAYASAANDPTVTDTNWIVCKPESPRSTGWTDVNGDTRHDEGNKLNKETGNVDFKSLLQYLLTIYALTYQRGCLGYAAVIADAIAKCQSKTITQADVDAASNAYNACLARG